MQTGHWLRVFDTTSFLGINLLEGQSEAGWQKWGVITLAALVGVTQIISLIITQRRQTKLKQEQQANVPAYRLQQQQSTQKQTETTMKIMMYVMTGMMVMFVLNSPAGLGLYWFVGNIYSTFQSFVSHKNSKKRLETLRTKF